MMLQKLVGVRCFGANSLRVSFAFRFRALSISTEARSELDDRVRLKGLETARSATGKLPSGLSDPSLCRDIVHGFRATPLPSHKELPTWAAAWKDDPSLVSVPHLRDVVAKVARIRGAFLTIRRTKDKQRVYCCTLKVHVGAERYNVQGKAAAAQQARKIAWLHMLARLHVRGKLDPPKGHKNTSLAPKVNQNALAEDANSTGASEPGTTCQSARSISLNVSCASYTLMECVPDLTSPGDSDIRDLSPRRARWFRLIGPAKALHSSALADAYASYHTDVLLAIRRARLALPMLRYRTGLMQMVDSNVYSILIGATGSGKTTQVPQLILEDWCRRGRGADCNIICTQPRVMAAVSVANRVGDELGERLKSRVGYHVRNHARIPQPRDGGITYCTTGILLQQLQYQPDLIFDNVSHLILDEVHERRMELDLTLTWLKNIVAFRLKRGLRVPRILLTSATLDKKVFVRHFKNFDSFGKPLSTRSLSVPGRAYPVREKYLEEVLSDIQSAHDCYALGNLRSKLEYQPSLKHVANELSLSTGDVQSGRAAASEQDVPFGDTSDEQAAPLGLIAETIAHVVSTTDKGAILVFLPGLGEINKVEEILKSSEIPIFGVDFNLEERYKLLKLHSSLPDSQQTVFQPVPAGIRKIILSSPVAETSVTIPDVTFVIDSGQVRELQYDHAIRASWLRNGWINGSSAKQRAGRAGRVQKGTYLALYSKARREAMPASGVPELLRADLQSVCLAVRSNAKHSNVFKFLKAAIDPPPYASVKDALKSLVDTGALTPRHDVTSLGRLLCGIPIHPSLAKMIVLAFIFKCLDPIIIAAVAIGERDMWAAMPELRHQALMKIKTEFAESSGSDLIATYNAFCYMRENSKPADEAARQKHLQLDVFDRIKAAAVTIRDALVSDGLLQRQDAGDADQRIGGDAFNVNSNNQNVVKAVLVAGLQANFGCAKVLGVERALTFSLDHRPDAKPSPFSVLNTNGASANDHIPLVVFGQLAVVNDLYIMRHVTAVSPITAALFGGSLAMPFTDAAPVVNNFLPLAISVWADAEADEPSNNEAWRVLEQFRKTLDQVLNIAFDNMARTRRGTSATTDESANVVAEFVDKVVQVLDIEANAEKLHLREAVMARRAKEQNEKKRKGEKEREKASQVAWVEKAWQKMVRSARGMGGEVGLDPVQKLYTRRHHKRKSKIQADLGSGRQDQWPESTRRFIFGMPSVNRILQRTSQSESQDGAEAKPENKGGNIQSK